MVISTSLLNVLSLYCTSVQSLISQNQAIIVSLEIARYEVVVAFAPILHMSQINVPKIVSLHNVNSGNIAIFGHCHFE